MNKTLKTLLALGAVGLTLAGCNGGGTSGSGKSAAPKAATKVAPAVITPGQEADLFPVKVGANWVYEATSTANALDGTKTSKSEVTFKVTEVNDTPEGKECTIAVSSDGTQSDTLVWRIATDGIFQLSGSRRNESQAIVPVKFEPPLKVVSFPVKPGEQIKTTVTGVRPGAPPGPFEALVSTEGVQEVDTFSDRVSALSTSQTSTYSIQDPKDKSLIKFKSMSTAYWAPKLGIVRYYQEVIILNSKNQSVSSTTILKLKSHS